MSDGSSIIGAIIRAEHTTRNADKPTSATPDLNTNPKTLEEGLEAIKTFLRANQSFVDLVQNLEALKLPKSERDISWNQFISYYLEDVAHGYNCVTKIGLMPVAVAAVAVSEFFKNPRFKVIDHTSYKKYDRVDPKPKREKAVFSTFDFAGNVMQAAIENTLFIEDTSGLTPVKYVIEYEPSPNGNLVLTIHAAEVKDTEAFELSKEIKKAVLQSPFIKGQVIEMHERGSFQVIDIGEPVLPVMDPELADELEKNIINLFDKEEEFKKYKLPVKRSIILSGPPGCGKTMIERYLAAKVRGKVTTVWVSSKSIATPQDVSEIFEIARGLSPVLVVFEDIDLVAGSRDEAMGLGHGASGSSCLGELLNQLDGLKPNDAMVVLASTNRVSSLDEAIADRPGRIDRVYEVKRPSSDVAVQIATRFMRKSNIEEATINSLNLSGVFADGENTGAQVVEIIKGAIFEAIHRGCELNDLCISASKKGLAKQRELFRRKSV